MLSQTERQGELDANPLRLLQMIYVMMKWI
jgi:hypothetical protein